MGLYPMELYYIMMSTTIFPEKKDEFEKQIIAKYHFPFWYILAVERDF